ncbi:hypothetical protein LCGC14_1156940 [marine sediment metagenome]|uniref:Terminase small subunit n=1 Tax=marine sediment metagenome TaxID=412755 RepID=A0A0F9PZB2_9ZZZZ
MAIELRDRPLTLGQIDFVSHICTDAVNNGSLAYQKAYPNCKSGHRQNARRLLTYDYIKQAITKFKAKSAKDKGFTVEDMHRMYEEDRDFASKVRAAGARVSASTGIARLYGMDKDAGTKQEQTIIIIGPKQAKVIDSKEIEDG